MSFFSETDIPGIGKKILISTHSKEKAALIIHHDGKRELYILDKNSDPIKGITLLDDEARRLGLFLSGIVYKPKIIEDLELALGGILIEWFKVKNNSQIIGKSIKSLDIRKRTNVSIIAILKEDETFIANPDSNYVFTEADTCVVIGKPDDFKSFLNIISKAPK